MELLTVARRWVAGFFVLQEGSDYFALLDLHLIYSAIHLKTHRRRSMRLLFRLYQQLLPVQCVIWFVRTLVVATVEHNTTLAISLACGQLSISVIAIRSAMMQRCCPRFSEVRAYINARRFLRGHPVAHAIRQRAFRTNNLILVLMQLYGLLNIFVFVFYDVPNHEIFRIPEYIRQTYEPLYWTMYVIVQPMVVCGLSTFMGIFLVSNALLLGLHAELQLVQFAFERVLQLVDSQVRQDASLRRGNDPHVREAFVWQTLNYELGCCIHEHCSVLHFVREVRQILSNSVTVQYYSALLALAVDAFFISYNGFDFVAFMVVVYSVLLVFEWFYCCKLVEDLQAIHQRIGWTLYNDNWPAWLECSERHRTHLRQFRDTLCIVMAVSQRSMSCHGSAIVEVSWRTFSNLFKTSYSVMMFLIEMRRINRANL